MYDLNLLFGKLKNYWFPLALLVFLLTSVVVTSKLNQQEQTVITKASGNKASIDLTSNVHSITVLSTPPSQNFIVPVFIDSNNIEIVAADIVINFDTNYLKLLDIIPQSNSSALKTFLPQDLNGSFNKTQVVENANGNGTIAFGVMSSTTESGTFASSTGIFQLSSLQFQPLKLGTTTIAVSYVSDSTADSNLVAKSSQDILGNVTNLTVAIVSPTPIPTSTSIPTPTSTLTLPNTSTSTSTPTPTSIPAGVNFHFKNEGISSQKPDITVKLRLSQNGNTMYSFNSLAATSAINGIFTTKISNIAPGTYDVSIKSFAHLTKKFSPVILQNGNNNIDLTASALLAGDSNGDDFINAQDIGVMMENYHRTATSVTADLNLDGTVNTIDTSMAIENYFQSGDQ